MHLGRYRLLAQRGAGRDGIAYRGQTPEGDPVEIRVLTSARADVDRWGALTRRLHLAALLDHPSARRVHHLDLDHDPPYLALAWSEAQCLAQTLGGRLPLALPEVAALAEELAAVLLAAHRLGLAHGQLGPSTIWQTSKRGQLLDFTGWDIATTELDASCRAPELVVGESADPSTDVSRPTAASDVVRRPGGTAPGAGSRPAPARSATGPRNDRRACGAGDRRCPR
jgi:hypothetical protein